MNKVNEAQARKDMALLLHESGKSDYIIKARQAAVKVAKKKGFVSINEVRRDCPPPDKYHPSVMGAILRGSVFEHTGQYIKAAHPASHARIVGVYKLRDYK
jgi:hypothetical protein